MIYKKILFCNERPLLSKQNDLISIHALSVFGIHALSVFGIHALSVFGISSQDFQFLESNINGDLNFSFDTAVKF
jgi:hypothetical protein